MEYMHAKLGIILKNATVIEKIYELTINIYGDTLKLKIVFSLKYSTWISYNVFSFYFSKS
jgi:hypothetical protein